MLSVIAAYTIAGGALIVAVFRTIKPAAVHDPFKELEDLRQLTDYFGWPCRRLHSPRAERMKVTPPSPPSAQSVQTKKKPPVDLAISP